MLPMPEESV
jgi:hypothetical protein